MINHLTIIGVGLLGGSIGLAVRSKLSHCKIMGCAHRDASLIKAKQLGAIDEWTLDPQQAVKNADLVVICAPVSLIPVWTEKIATFLKPGTIVTDVGSTKAWIVEEGEKLLPKEAHFIGSHPMAGSEQKGVSVARSDLFEGATCIVTRTESSSDQATRIVENFWKTLGCRIVCHSPQDHDRLVALVSHLPHVVASALVAVQEPNSIDLRGKGFLDSTRIAAGDPELWRDILMDNRQNVIAAIVKLTKELSQLSELLRADDPDAVQKWLADHAETRSKI